MGVLILFILYVIFTIGAVVTALYIGCYSILLAICFAVLYVVTVKIVSDQIKED